MFTAKVAEAIAIFYALRRDRNLEYYKIHLVSNAQEVVDVVDAINGAEDWALQNFVEDMHCRRFKILIFLFWVQFIFNYIIIRFNWAANCSAKFGFKQNGCFEWA